MVIIIRLLCVSTEAILALRDLIDWLQTKGSLYSRQDIIRLNRFSVETRPCHRLRVVIVLIVVQDVLSRRVDNRIYTRISSSMGK